MNEIQRMLNIKMFVSFLFAVCFNSINAQTKFTFETTSGKRFTLLNQNGQIRKSSRINAKLRDQKRWYYVHFLSDLPTMQKYVDFRLDDQIIKDTFILYLSEGQIEKISPYSLVKLIEPSEKINLHSDYNETNYFRIETADKGEILAINDLFSIEKVNNDNSIIVRVDQNKKENEKEFINRKKNVVTFLSQLPAVKTVSTYKKPVLQNNINIGYVQKNKQSFRRDEYSKLYLFDRYVHDHNLTGEGQIITIVDSPIDFRHPMFHDDNVELEFNKDMPDHRKFLYYRSDIDMKEWEDNLKDEEHGTHTAGTLAGKSVVTDKSKTISHLFDGAAPDAKLVYAGLYGNVTGAEIEEAMKAHNSRISSNSWGDDDKYVDSLNHEYGSLAYNNPNSIFIFAAGNYGIFGPYSIIDPSGSKNVLSVSATSNPLLKNAQQFVVQSENDSSIFIKCTGIFSTKDFEYSSEFLGAKRDEAKIIAVHYEKDDQGSDDAVCKMLNGSYISLLYGDNYEEMAEFFDFCFTETTDGILITDNVDDVKKLLENHDKIRARLNGDVDEVLPIIKGSYASIGPGNKGMMKPDVTAPGTTIVSARSYHVDTDSYDCKDVNDGCGLVFKDGTSMSTPIVAGGAALVAQYFKSGKWIDSTELDGSTMRALIINSCNHPSNSKQPDTFFGHGVVDLSSILPLEGGFGVEIPLQNKSNSVKENGHVAAKIEVKSNKVDLQITLSYLDVMLEESSPIPLTRDLDLVVVDPVGNIFMGDHLNGDDSEHFSTNEKVIVKKDEIKVGTYTVHVYGNKFFDSDISSGTLSQNFSVVATGDIENKYLEFVESTESPCAESDPEKPGYCKCKENELGPLCQAKVVVADNPEGYNKYTLEPRDIKRVLLKSDKEIKGLNLYVYTGIMFTAAWISPSCHLGIQEYETHVLFPMYEPETIDIDFGTNEICVAIFANCPETADYYLQIVTEGNSTEPTTEPTTMPTTEPTTMPTTEPTIEPTTIPTTEPTIVPTSEPEPSDDSQDDKPKKLRTVVVVVILLGAAFTIAVIATVIAYFIKKKKANDNIPTMPLLTNEIYK